MQYLILSHYQTPILPSRIFLVVSILLNIILFAASLFLHWRQGRIDALDRGERSKVNPLNKFPIQFFHLPSYHPSHPSLFPQLLLFPIPPHIDSILRRDSILQTTLSLKTPLNDLTDFFMIPPTFSPVHLSSIFTQYIRVISAYMSFTFICCAMVTIKH